MKSNAHPDKLRVLIIDDDPTIRTVIKTILSQEGLSIGAAKDAEEALALLRPPAIPYDLVLLDINLPGESGIELLKQMRDQKINVPVLMISGNSDQQNIEEAASLQIKGFIVKPFTAQLLKDKVEAALNIEPIDPGSFDPDKFF